MDHPARLSDPLIWRRTAIAAAALAAFELLLLVMIALAFIGRPIFSGGEEGPRALPAKETPAATPTKKAAKPAPAGPKLTRTETSVIVLNGNGSPGAASEKADMIRTRGYLIAATGNAPRTDFARTVVMYRPGYEPEARRLARDFRINRVAPLDGLRKSDLQGAHLALIVGDS